MNPKVPKLLIWIVRANEFKLTSTRYDTQRWNIVPRPRSGMSEFQGALGTAGRRDAAVFWEETAEEGGVAK